jgi:hypothetical protein
VIESFEDFDGSASVPASIVNGLSLNALGVCSTSSLVASALLGLSSRVLLPVSSRPLMAGLL